ncbi:MAG: hypothetical protein AAF657_14685 [Acidobacteriota bacterium]
MCPSLRRYGALGFVLFVCVLFADQARAETRVYDIPVIGGYATSVLFHTITPPGSTVLNVTFIATYDTSSTGLDAKYAQFELVRFSDGTEWAFDGSDLGWSGTGTFQSVRSTSRFNGPLEGTVLWETLTSWAPGNLSGRFRVLVELGDFTPPCQQVPNPCLP